MEFRRQEESSYSNPLPLRESAFTRPLPSFSPALLSPLASRNSNLAAPTPPPIHNPDPSPPPPSPPAAPTAPLSSATPPTPDPDPSTRYRECLRNHAAALGGHVLDGCGEFMPEPHVGMKCAACGCHRSFHRKEEEGEQSPFYAPLGRVPLLLPPPRPHHHNRQFGGFLPSPTAIVGSGGGTTESSSEERAAAAKKRFRTKFSSEQKNRMLEFATRVGWRIQKENEGEMERVCSEIGVSRQVVKVWMHNNKHTMMIKKSEEQQHQHQQLLQHHQLQEQQQHEHEHEHGREQGD